LRRFSWSARFETLPALQILADVPVVALAPASVGNSLPDRIAAVRIDDPPDPLETAVVWRTDDALAAAAAFRDVARSLAFAAPMAH
jgi:hypothetical protein